jgi:hypothetical protein
MPQKYNKRDYFEVYLNEYKSPIRDAQEQLYNELVKSIDDEMSKNMSEVSAILPKQILIDFGEIKEKADSMSERYMKKIVKFFVLNKNTKDTYIEEKMQLDKLILSSLIFQMKTAEHSIIKLLEQIDSGNISPKMFDSLGNLQKSKMDIIKHLVQFMVILETSYKNLNQDIKMGLVEIEEKSSEYLNERQFINEEKYKAKGSKSLIEELRKIIPEKLED